MRCVRSAPRPRRIALRTMQAGPASRRRTTAAPAALGPRRVALPGRALLARPGGRVRALTATPGAEAPFEGCSRVRSLPVRARRSRPRSRRVPSRCPVPRSQRAWRQSVGECRWIGESARYLDRRSAHRVRGRFDGARRCWPRSLTNLEVGHVAGLSAQNLAFGRSPRPRRTIGSQRCSAACNHRHRAAHPSRTAVTDPAPGSAPWGPRLCRRGRPHGRCRFWGLALPGPLLPGLEQPLA